MEKSVYIRQLKRLIKKYHPDLCDDEHLESMYQEITKKLVNVLNRLKTDEGVKAAGPGNSKEGLVTIKEPDYVYYKLGIKYYKNIHPNMLYKNQTKGNYETKQYDDLVGALNNIFLSFNLSRHYFSRVIEDYPRSLYAEDARDKIKLLKKLYKRYENMTVTENETCNYDQYIHEMGLNIL